MRFIVEIYTKPHTGGLLRKEARRNCYAWLALRAAFLFS
nr:MAG TPA: hypothetical protein [Caudoviricetes sp.]